MKRRWIGLVLVLSLLLSGCSWLDGSYVSITPHREQSGSDPSEVVSATNYTELIDVLESFVASGREKGVINVANYELTPVENQMIAAERHILEIYPVGAYAVEDIRYELGTNSGKPALAVEITYRRSILEIRRIQSAENMEEAAELIGQALERLDTTLTIQVSNYRKTDLEQIVRNYAREHPQTVMEVPQVAFADYGSGYPRVVEITFSYQTDRDSLRQMKGQVKPVFDSAALYVSGEGSEKQKFSQLYSFLMERFDYKIETSITPAYSLLRHGVGDSRAFALVYEAMCRAAELDCRMVTGTRNGEPWTWNIIREGESYYHVDLLRSSQQGSFRKLLDNEMTGYVWDYSAYPECVAPVVPPTEGVEEIIPEETATDPTEQLPEETTQEPPEK